MQYSDAPCSVVVSSELVDDSGAPTSTGEGELVLKGMACATAGYLPGSGGRDLSGGSGVPTSERFFTGDIFRSSGEADTLWLHHVCRQAWRSPRYSLLTTACATPSSNQEYHSIGRACGRTAHTSIVDLPLRSSLSRLSLPPP